MPDAYPMLFERALAALLDARELATYKSAGQYSQADATPARPGVSFGTAMPTTYNNALVINTREAVPEGRADLIHRIQIITRVEGRVPARNLAWSLFTTLHNKERLFPEFRISWSWLFSQTDATADTQGRFTTYQNFYFRGRRPQA